MPSGDRITKLSKDFKVDIPKSICDAHGWIEGQEFALTPKGQGVLLLPIPSLDEMRGIARGAAADDYRDRVDRY